MQSFISDFPSCELVLHVVHKAKIPVHIVSLFCSTLCSAGEFITWVALDHELQAHHEATVLVTDHGSPPRNATMVVYVSVTDINDNRPYFPQCLPGKELHIKVCGVKQPCSDFAVFLAICFEHHLVVKSVNLSNQSWYGNAYISRRSRNCAHVKKTPQIF